MLDKLKICGGLLIFHPKRDDENVIRLSVTQAAVLVARLGIRLDEDRVLNDEVLQIIYGPDWKPQFDPDFDTPPPFLIHLSTHKTLGETLIVHKTLLFQLFHQGIPLPGGHKQLRHLTAHFRLTTVLVLAKTPDLLNCGHLLYIYINTPVIRSQPYGSAMLYRHRP